MMKASTQLIDDLAGVGLPSDEPGIFNFVINDHTIAVFWKPLGVFWTTDGYGQEKRALRSAR
jgi:hypothetical protein